MKFARVGPVGAESPAVMVNDEVFVDISDIVPDINADAIVNLGSPELQRAIRRRIDQGPQQSIAGKRIGSPISRPHQILCVGLNYSDHAIESNMSIPAEPIIFNKAPNTIAGPNDPVFIPRNSRKTDWEVELGVVIGQRVSYLASPDDAADAIAGYLIVNDVSEREFQLERGGQWVKGKSCDSFNPCGPWLATPDEILDAQDLDMWLDVNGERMQEGSTRTMIFPVNFLVWYLSQFMVLEPGDLINTGTPPGVGLGKKPPRYLAPGDVMEVGIQGLGLQRQVVEKA